MYMSIKPSIETHFGSENIFVCNVSYFINNCQYRILIRRDSHSCNKLKIYLFANMYMYLSCFLTCLKTFLNFIGEMGMSLVYEKIIFCYSFITWILLFIQNSKIKNLIKHLMGSHRQNVYGFPWDVIYKNYIMLVLSYCYLNH